MIHQPDVKPLLLAACPSFEPQWDAFIKQWKDVPYGLAHTVPLAKLAQHLIDLLKRGDTVEFPATFHVIERLLVEGDDSVRSTARGLLQTLVEAKTYEHAEPEALTAYLGAVSARCWHALQDLRRRLTRTRCVHFNDWGMGVRTDVSTHYLPWDEIVAISALAIIHPRTSQSFTILGFYGLGRAFEVDEAFEGWTVLLDALPSYLEMTPGWRETLAAFRHGDPPPRLFQRGPLPEWVRCLSGLKDE